MNDAAEAPLSAEQIADIEKVAREPRFREIYEEERRRFPHATHKAVLERARRAWFLPAV